MPTGRESTLNESLYYFYVKFTNNAGKDAEIVIPGTKKTNAIPSGKSLSLKFSRFKMEPADFVALSKPFKEPLFLNDLPVMNIKPDLDADKVVPVTITNPRKCCVRAERGVLLVLCFLKKPCHDTYSNIYITSSPRSCSMNMSNWIA